MPDARLEAISGIVQPEKTTPATVTFIDIAGLVKGAHKGEGLGNQFLAKIREVSAIVHVVRAFESISVPHIHGKIDPKGDIEIVNLELELGGITQKPILYVLNIDEKDIKSTKSIKRFKETVGDVPMIMLSAQLEEELNDFSQQEQKEYLKELGIRKSGLEQVIQEAYKLLNLITFYTTKGGKEVRAWSIKEGTVALGAAATVHTDFSKHFIKAEVVSFEDFVACGGWKKARELGKARLEGRDYVVRDGDVVEFKVNA